VRFVHVHIWWQAYWQLLLAHTAILHNCFVSLWMLLLVVVIIALQLSAIITMHSVLFCI
jgi:hypothetical protein